MAVEERARLVEGGSTGIFKRRRFHDFGLAFAGAFVR
jgi:hypothetical protein